jgi:hypothetical protein
MTMTMTTMTTTTEAMAPLSHQSSVNNRSKIFRMVDLLIVLLLSVCPLVSAGDACMDLNDDEADNPFW